MRMKGCEQDLPPFLGTDVIVQVGDHQLHWAGQRVPVPLIYLNGGTTARARTGGRTCYWLEGVGTLFIVFTIR